MIEAIIYMKANKFEKHRLYFFALNHINTITMIEIRIDKLQCFKIDIQQPEGVG